MWVRVSNNGSFHTCNNDKRVVPELGVLVCWKKHTCRLMNGLDFTTSMRVLICRKQLKVRLTYSQGYSSMIHSKHLGHRNTRVKRRLWTSFSRQRFSNDSGSGKWDLCTYKCTNFMWKKMKTMINWHNFKYLCKYNCGRNIRRNFDFLTFHI